MPKNIVVFSDGTGQEGGKGNDSNVYKLFNMVLDRTPEQIVFYDRGLGTGWRKLTGSIGGRGISKNIRECYEFIFENYMAGDQIYLFGFSRGATTVRSLSGFIHLFGVLPKSRHELIKRAWRIYKKRDDKKRKQAADEFVKRHHKHWCRIKVLGVWDTVAALGLPFKSLDVIVNWFPMWRHKFHDLRLSDSVENAYHALSIDDDRRTFHPTLWDRGVARHQLMKQVWFCGAHSDVGGGYADAGLSDIALEWIVQEAVEHGLRIYPKHRVRAKPDPNGIMHNPRSGLGRFYRRKDRSWNAKTHGKPVLHESVLKRMLNKRNEEQPAYSSWILREDYAEEPRDESVTTMDRGA